MSKVFSTKKELKDIRSLLLGYLKLPFSNNLIPGNVMEKILGEATNSKVLNTYDFIDVVNEKKKVGWQVKSTKENTTLTWKRVKLPNSKKLIEDSFKSNDNIQILGDMIIDFCNKNTKESIDAYDLKEVGFSRVIVNNDNTITYYEKLLCTKENPNIFKKEDYIWKWSEQKTNAKKEQLSSLQAFDKRTGKKVFSWYGQGENQLHFFGEKEWLDNAETINTFKMPEKKYDMDFLKNI